MADRAPRRRVDVVVLAFGSEPLLERCVRSILSSSGVEVRLFVVDNGCTSESVQRIASEPGVRVLRPGRNTGFAGGCNLGVAATTADVVALINSDVVVTKGALAALCRAVEDPAVGLATANVRLLDRPDVVNTVGNPVHYLGLSWAGGLGDPAAWHQTGSDVASASGAAVAVRRVVWELLGGFWEAMFAYCEDAELSLRCWQHGLRVVYVPEAVVHHHYEFSRNALKYYLAERNRLALVLTLYDRRTLLLLAPALLGLEAAVLLVALSQGWAGQKVRGWWWLCRHAGLVRERRRLVQRTRTRADRELACLLTGDFTPGPDAGISAPPFAGALSRRYWSVVRRFLR